MTPYFSERENGPTPRVVETIDSRVWGGLYALVSARIADDSFGFRFPAQCPDGHGPCGYDARLFQLTLDAEVPKLGWPLSSDTVPELEVIMDFLEFAANAIGAPEQGSWHSYFSHHHLSWNRASGLQRFVADVNRLFARNGVAFELTGEGVARRILPALLHAALQGDYKTGDVETDRLLDAARKLIAVPEISARRDALEKLWDAFERLKTLEPGEDKRTRANALLDRMADSNTPKMRMLLGDEARNLTEIGNRFRIRHSETAQEMPAGPEHIDYLFHRMYSFIRLMLQATGRIG